MASSGASSNVGQGNIYEAGDQRNPPQSEIRERERYEEGQSNSHQKNDSKDQRSIANRLAAAEEKKASIKDDIENIQHKKDPTLPARSHGNEPSRGAQIDAELQAEDEERLKQKGPMNMPGKKN